MRLDHLQLLRYGKFTDATITFPQAGVDFHVVVGANEAGKSTLRNAISDLFYGFLPRNALPAFLHPMNELRLGARLVQDGAQIEVHRTKGNKNTLRAPDDRPLPDDVLEAFLGASDRTFFEKVFGLNHQRLVDGGHQILTAGNDIGQVLFESAAGVASLGPVRAELQKEADALWGRKSGQREYHIAHAEYEQAVDELKRITVRTKQWTESQARVQTLESELAALRQQQAELRAQRDDFERMRRIAPHVADWRTLQTQAQILGHTALLPNDAAEVFAAVAAQLAQADTALALHRQTQADSARQLEGLHLDAVVLRLRGDIESLHDMRLRCGKHEVEISRQEAEIAGCWQRARHIAQRLGWPAPDEATLRSRVPALPARKSLDALVKRRVELQTRLQSMDEGRARGASRLERLQRELQAAPAVSSTLDLQSALNAALALGDAEDQHHRHRAEVEDWSAACVSAGAQLGRWNMEIERLQALDLPGREQIEALLQDDAHDSAQARAMAVQIESLQSTLASQRAEVARFRQAYQPVTRQDVEAAREQRNAAWNAIRDRADQRDADLPGYERLVEAADRTSDRRESTVEEAASLQHKEYEVQRLEAELAGATERLERLKEAMAGRAQRWEARMAEIGLAGLPLERCLVWADARQAALTADQEWSRARRQHDRWVERMDQAARALREAIAGHGRAVPSDAPLATLILHAGAVVEDGKRAEADRVALDRQVEDARASLVDQELAVKQAHNELQRWTTEWAEATAKVGILPDTDPDAAQAALELIGELDLALADMARLQGAGIDAMRADLAGLRSEAERLCVAAGWQIEGRPGAVLATSLYERLQAAIDVERQSDALVRARDAAARQIADTQAASAVQAARLQPLRTLAQADDLEQLHAAIVRSDNHRRLQAQLAAAEQAVREGSDGLELQDALARLEATDVAGLPQHIAALSEDMEEIGRRQNDVSVQLSTARGELERISGSEDAARAEGQRQEAVARMATAIERYVKVSTAARLLRWAIDRYRETRQGPMLQRAGHIFAGLTRGSFERLSVDFDSEPLTLNGRRADGRLVPVEGMSEGTRDQLYLALRLAALHLHLDKAHALPFVADDLFINYDDGRSEAGLRALGELAQRTQVIFLTHHEHLLPVIERALGPVNIIRL